MDAERTDGAGTDEEDYYVCEHERTCEDCKDHGRDLGAAAQLIVNWSAAIGLLVDEARKSPAPTWLNAIDGLSFAIATIAEMDILSETPPARRPVARLQAPEPVRRAS
jgi:hypothetical protein